MKETILEEKRNEQGNRPRQGFQSLKRVRVIIISFWIIQARSVSNWSRSPGSAVNCAGQGVADHAPRRWGSTDLSARICFWIWWWQVARGRWTSDIVWPFPALNQRKFLWVRRGCQASQRKGLTSGEVRGTSGEVWETSGEPLVTVKLHSERTSREVAEKPPGKFGELPGKSGGFPEARGSLTPSQRLAKFISNSKRASLLD